MEPEVRVGTLEGEDVYMLGDVHGLGVGADGSMYVYDRQVPALRQYDGDGRYLSTFGREGGGPGEYRQSDGGLAVLPDGRVLLRDPANGRINVYSAVGEPLDHWPLRGGHFTSRPLYVDTAGNIYTQIWGTNADGERYGGLQRISPDGEPGDSLLAPDWDYEPALLTAAGESFRMSSAVPFTPREVWAFSPDGSFVGGVADAYEFDVFRPDGTVLRIGREYDPVPVHPDEAENARARTAANFKGMAPDWRWNGPGIPDVKPAYTAVFTGRDGRIWVRVSVPGVRLRDDGAPGGSGSSRRPGAPPPDRWEEPVVFDVFEPGGTYLGRVRAPDGFSEHPAPVFDREHVWAVVSDDLDIEYLVRFRLSPPARRGARTALPRNS